MCMEKGKCYRLHSIYNMYVYRKFVGESRKGGGDRTDANDEIYFCKRKKETSRKVQKGERHPSKRGEKRASFFSALLFFRGLSETNQISVKQKHRQTQYLHTAMEAISNAT